ncbi:GMP synthase [Mucilaginibacter robiniae]|uniref:GMP synthase n=1 Tax=Mucilaginibacter robiniae TaxID=2728022 RepID=A0A7L5DWW9_9SPHI|nr:GMP synthase [Mucilaginibacter robiniae]QJD95525.1 GMP synthase [Mucilaginibacter robiniae]
MATTTKDTQEIKIAILDLYDGQPNQGMRCFQEIVARYKISNHVNLSYQIFDVRKKEEVPGTEFDIYLSSGGPGSPIDSEGSNWETKYFNLIDQLEEHNQTTDGPKKHVFFVCHSFQLMCRRLQLGNVSLRRSPSFGVLPVNLVEGGLQDVIFEGLNDPFYAVDSRSWQVVHPNEEQFKATGATLLAIEKERPHIDLPRAIMAVRFNEYFVGTQFHPEADPVGMTAHLLNDEKKQQVVDEHGEAKYHEMIERLEDPDKILLTQTTMIPNFLDQAILSLQEA